jgi:hypothetical protein
MLRLTAVTASKKPKTDHLDRTADDIHPQARDI